MTAAIMVQGTGSDVGKSLLVAGLCRAFTRAGMKVRPFKPQNMSNNAAVAADGGEIGRAQALQALACGVAPSVHMNPVLLKPETDRASQLIVRGQRVGRAEAASYISSRGGLLAAVMESYRELCRGADLVIVEGAGSPAEVNLRKGDIANMGFARAAQLPVILAGDIHRGGVIASLVGTKAVLDKDDAALIKAFVVNRFRGDPKLFDDGVRMIETATGWPCLGVLPELPQARLLPAEDAVALEHMQPAIGTGLNIVVPVLPRIANFDDVDPLRLTEGVRLTMLPAGEVLPGDTDLVLLPGSKATIADLAFLRAQGWDIDIAAHVRRGGRVLGVCGGYQMLGRTIHDPQGIEGPADSVDGLGLLDIETILTADKHVKNVAAVHAASATRMTCYEIHLGETVGPDCARPFAHIAGKSDGARTPDGRVEGTYLHGLFIEDAFRTAYLRTLDATVEQGPAYTGQVEAALDAIADTMCRTLDMGRILSIARAGIG